MQDYKVYQIPHPEEGCSSASVKRNYDLYAFQPLKRIDAVRMSRYRKVYEGRTPNMLDVKQALDQIYMQLNVMRPTDYQARSLSVSDIVEIGGEYYYCDSIGWQKVRV